MSRSSRALRENRELDDWIDLLFRRILDFLTKRFFRLPVARIVYPYDGKVLYRLEWIAVFRTLVHNVEWSVSAKPKTDSGTDKTWSGPRRMLVICKAAHGTEKAETERSAEIFPENISVPIPNRNGKNSVNSYFISETVIFESSDFP